MTTARVQARHLSRSIELSEVSGALREAFDLEHKTAHWTMQEKFAQEVDVMGSG